MTWVIVDNDGDNVYGPFDDKKAALGWLRPRASALHKLDYAKVRELRRIDMRKSDGKLLDAANDRIEKALEVAFRFGGTDGDHHKMWVIDQMVRALSGCPEIVAKGHHPEFKSMGTNAEYEKWVRECKAGEDGPDTYEWDEGIAP